MKSTTHLIYFPHAHTTKEETTSTAPDYSRKSLLRCSFSFRTESAATRLTENVSMPPLISRGGYLLAWP